MYITMKKCFLSLLVSSVIGFSLLGCVHATDSSTVHHPTVGQQLVDLKRALEQGAMSEAEYEVERFKVLGH